MAGLLRARWQGVLFSFDLGLCSDLQLQVKEYFWLFITVSSKFAESNKYRERCFGQKESLAWY